MVDNEDFNWLSKHKWHAIKAHNTFYAARHFGKRPNRKRIWMHREILNVPKGKQTDHINHHGWDNRKVNLRICTRSQNHQNEKPQKGKTSNYKGVFLQKHNQKWQAQIKINAQPVHLGFFVNERDAAKAYNDKAKELFGEFAHLNIL